MHQQVLLDIKSSTLDNFPMESFEASHTDMCKYAGPTDDKYRAVRDAIKGFILFSPTRQLWQQIRLGAGEYVEMLLRAGADPNLPNASQQSALHQAVQFDNKGVIPVLLRHGANLNLIDGNGNSALEMAAIAGKLNIYRMLRQFNARVNSRVRFPDNLQHPERESAAFAGYVPGKRLDARTRVGRSEASTTVQLSPECEAACRESEMIITSFCPNEIFPLRRYRQKETVYDALYTNISEDIIPPRSLPEFESIESLWYDRKSEENLKADFTWYHLPANNVSRVSCRHWKSSG
jgi:hypothetical protein